MDKHVAEMPRNELRGSISWRISFTLVITLAISLTVIYKIDTIKLTICNVLLGINVVCVEGENDSVPETPDIATPVSLSTRLPPISIVSRGRGICEISTLVEKITDKLKITVTSIVVEDINVDLVHLTINFIVENLTSEFLTLKLDGNTGIYESGKTDIVAAPELEFSTSPIKVPANEKKAARMSVDRLWSQLNFIDIEFRRFLLDETPVDEVISMIGIPVSC